MKLKRIMAMVLCVAMVLSTMGTAVFAEGDVVSNNVSTAEELAAALLSDEQHIAITLANDIEVPMSSLGTQTAGSGEYKLGGDNTESIEIDLNTHKLTITTSYMSAIGAKNDDATITIKNGSMNSTGNSSKTWNINDLMFANCNYEFENVIFDKEVALTNTGKNVTMKDVTINGTGDYYALWIQAEGQNVTIDGLTINTPGRGIKIDEEYTNENVAKVTLDVSNATFTTAKKAAIMVKSVAGAEITLSNVDISGVVEDSKNIVWVDEDSADYQEKVTVNGGSAFTEGTVATVNGVVYTDVATAFVEADDDDEVVICAAGTYEVPGGKNITITGAVDGVVFDNIGAHNMGGASVTFNNVTFEYGNENYKGLQHAGDMTYNDCTINGQVFLYGNSETFNNCTFNQTNSDAYNVWTYGAKKVDFNECTFNSAGKSVLIYSEQADLVNDVTVTKTSFNASAAVEGKAAIEMDSSLTAGINLAIDSETTATGFGTGNKSGNSLWNNKKGNDTEANNDITVTVNDETVLEPVTLPVKVATKDELVAAIANSTDGDRILLTADIDYGTDHLEIKNAITLDLGSKTLTTKARNYGLALRNDACVVTNGKLNHAGTVAAIKVWDAKEISNLEIDVTGTSASGNTIDGIVIQENAAGVDTVKNVKIHSTAGQGVAVGIKTYKCGNASENVIGTMEKVSIDAKNAGMFISAPCGTASNCTIKGGTTGIELALEGTYTATLSLEGCDVKGGTQALYIHDEGKGYDYIGLIKLDADDNSTFASEIGERLTYAVAKAEDVELNKNIQLMMPLEGSGTKEDPYLINNVDDLVKFRYDVNSGDTYEGKYVLLTADIDFEGYEEMNVNYQGNNVSASTFRPIADYANSASFKGTFDGGNNTISNLYISGWDINYHWDNYGCAGLFGTVENATIKNLTVEGFEIQVEGGDVAAIAGHAIGDCTFENITVTDSKIATYNNGCAGITAWSEAGDYTFKDIEITDSVVLAGLWGSFDSSIGGVLAQADNNGTYLFENVDVACRLDVYNDVTASYDYYNYRMCGMLIGRSQRYRSDNPREVDLSNVTCKNVNITIGEWANYHYCDPTPGYNNGRGMRVEPGFSYDGLPADYDHSTCTTHHMTCIPMTSIVGGGQYGYSGTDKIELVEIGFTGITVTDLAFNARHEAVINANYYETLDNALENAQAGDKIVLLKDINRDVAINKSITLDGADKNYTGTMTLNAANITVQNLNFVGGNIVKGNSTKNGANITIKGCDFDGQNAGDYAVNLRLTGAIVIEDCTAKDYGYGFLQVPKSNNTISVKNVEISGVNYGFKIDYSNNVVFEDVTITDTLYGIMDSNYGPKTYTIKNCNIDATNSLYLWERSAAKTDTFMYVGENNFGTGTVTTSDYAILKLADSDAVLKACEGLTVTSTNEIYSVVYEDGAYKVQKVAKVGENHYYSLQEAIDAANDGDIITLVADIKTVQNVTINKNVVVDLNGHTVNGAILPSNGDITVKNGWIKNTDNSQSAIEINSGKLNLANVNIESARHAVRIDGEVEAVIDGGTYKVVPVDGKTVHAVNVSGNANVVIKNGEFIGPKGTVADSGAAVNVQEGSTVTIEGGTFTRGKNNTLATKGTLAIYGGIYDQDPSAYVVDGYKTSDKANNFYVVYPEFKVSAIVNDADKTVKAGEEFEVYITVTGGDYTNAGWKLGYDPTKVEYIKAQGGVDAVDYAIVDSVLGEGQTSGNEYKNGEVYKKYTFRAKYPSTTVNSVFTIENVYVNNYEMAAWLDKTPAAMEGDTVTITNDLAFGGTIADKEVDYNGMYQKAEEFVANMTGAEVTYSTEENGKYTTEVPSFKDAGEHTYYYKATLAGYTTVTGSAKLTINPATLAPTAEFNVDPDYDTVNVKAVIENLIDNSFKGTVTIEVDGEKVTFEAAEFTYDGNGRAIANQFKKVDLAEGKEYPVKVTYTANAAGDNYKDATSETTVNPDKKEITSDDLNNIKAALTNSYVYDGVEHFVKVDEANLPGEWKVEIPEIGLTDVGETMVTIKATDASGKYNEHTFNVVLKVTPKDITIVINNASKDLGQADPVFTSNINELLVVADHLGEVKYVREPGEAMGTYKINVTYTPNPNYNVVDIVEGNLYIGAPTDFKVEVVNNKLLKGDDYKQDYIAGYRLVLVYTNVDKAYFTYKGQEMYDVSDAPYEYYDYDFTTMTATKDTTEYKHIYAIVVDAEYGYEDTTENEAMYANNVEFASETAKPEKILYNSDINYTGELDVEDFSITNGVYNVLYRGKAFITRLLKADVNGNKLVDTEDAGMIKEVVVK